MGKTLYKIMTLFVREIWNSTFDSKIGRRNYRNFSLKSASVIPIKIPFNLGILGLGEHRLQSLGTFHRVV